MGRPRAFDVDWALDRAISVFRERGYGGASIDALQAATGLTTGSIYKAFGSKQKFFAAAYARYVAGRRAVMAGQLDKAMTGRQRIAATLHSYIDAASGDHGRRGCLVVASLIEASTLDAPLRDTVATTLAENRAGLFAMLEDGKQDGSVRADVPVEPCADLLLSLLQGLRATGKLRDPVDRDGLVELTLKILD
ncbi:TetR/AcrR family transcriptional regulator [Sphingomonas endolithica]|uniref:TetR/AcrR family transcriptional regulator n=1 Tax=Sphingomonas endolithica TaxID=2972485 RepID=UPI0021B05D8C|nr:TetR/AcrR family transcriptional regulator [Sphingomonas sp. ZFBP2030]